MCAMRYICVLCVVWFGQFDYFIFIVVSTAQQEIHARVNPQLYLCVRCYVCLCAISIMLLAQSVMYVLFELCVLFCPMCVMCVIRYVWYVCYACYVCCELCVLGALCAMRVRYPCHVCSVRRACDVRWLCLARTG